MGPVRTRKRASLASASSVIGRPSDSPFSVAARCRARAGGSSSEVVTSGRPSLDVLPALPVRNSRNGVSGDAEGFRQRPLRTPRGERANNRLHPVLREFLRLPDAGPALQSHIDGIVPLGSKPKVSGVDARGPVATVHHAHARAATGGRKARAELVSDAMSATGFPVPPDIGVSGRPVRLRNDAPRPKPTLVEVPVGGRGAGRVRPELRFGGLSALRFPLFPALEVLPHALNITRTTGCKERC